MGEVNLNAPPPDHDNPPENPPDTRDEIPNPYPDTSPVIPRPKICPNCMTPNEEYAHLCRTCFTPLSSHATIDPIYGISARADTFSKASNNPHKPIVFICMWLLFGPITFILLLALITMWQTGSFFGLLLVLAFLYIPVALLYKTTANFLKRKPTQRRGFPLVEDHRKRTSDEDEDGMSV